MIPLLNLSICMTTCYYEQLSFASEVTSRSAVTRVFCNSVPGETKCHPFDFEQQANGAKTATNCPSKCCFLFSFFDLLQVFVGNTDENTIVYNELNGSIVARYTRFQPTAWHNHISMRVELYGCKGTFFLVTSFFCGIRKKYKQILA